MKPKIKKIEKLYENKSYDRIKNPNKLNVKQLSPIGVAWKTSDNSFHEIIDLEYKIFSEYYDDRHIIIIRAPFEQDIHKNNCYLLDVNGDIVVDFRHLLLDKFENNLYYFSDIYRVDNNLFFLVIFKTLTYRFQFDFDRKIIFNFAEIKW